MGDRYRTLTVVLSNDVDQDDIDDCVNAIKSFRFVADVTKHPVSLQDFTARMAARTELRQTIMEILYPREKS